MKTVLKLVLTFGIALVMTSFLTGSKASAATSSKFRAGAKAARNHEDEFSENDVPVKNQISLRDALVRIGEISPLILQANQRVKEAEAGVDVAESAMLPQLSAQALWSNGNPGVFSVAGVDANLSTGSRVGEGFGLDLKQDIYDFGRSQHGIKAERARKKTEQTTLATQKSQAQLELLRVYSNCAYLTSAVSTSQRIVGLSKMVARETDRFVQSGQRSIIERYLVDSQTEEAETRVAETKAKLEVVQKRLTKLLQFPTNTDAMRCGNLTSLMQEAKSVEPSNSLNAFLQVENERLKQFDELLKAAHADYLPKFFLEAQGGYFNAERLDQNWNYGVGVGIMMPIYTGDRIEAKVEQAQAQYEFQKAVVARTTERVEQENFGYDEQIQSLDVRLAYIEKENQLAMKVFDLARNRYTRLQGTMIDLRDSIRELTRVLEDRDRTVSQLSQSLVQRSLWNQAFAR